MKKALILPLLAACGLVFCACSVLQQNDTPAGADNTTYFEMNRQRVADIQQAARECSSMRWDGVVSQYNIDTHSYIDEKHTYPVSEADASTIRGLLTRLRASKVAPWEHCPNPRAPYMASTLHFLDADGKTIVSLQYSVYGSDLDDTNGCLTCPGLSLLKADHAKWLELIPADLRRRYAKVYSSWDRKHK